MLKKKEKINVALLIEARVVLFLITIKYGINPIKIKVQIDKVAGNC
jgi:hypothetical protein